MNILPRVYGTPDTDSDTLAPGGGMRGERNNSREGKTPPREFAGADGKAIAVQETSGTAGVEAESKPKKGDQNALNNADL